MAQRAKGETHASNPFAGGAEPAGDEVMSAESAAGDFQPMGE
jgi:hypothetical protein